MSLLKSIEKKLCSLVIFRNLRSDPVVSLFLKLAETAPAQEAQQLRLLSDISYLLLEAGESLTGYLLNQVLSDENPYITKLASGGVVSPELTAAADYELSVIQEVSGITAETLQSALACSLPMYAWETKEISFVDAYKTHIAAIRQTGYGLFHKHHMFMVGGEKLIPIENNDPIVISDLTGYETERTAVLDNTKALLQGLPARNVLLYGDAGTGKSTTVKAIANTLKEEGLRLIELRKDQISSIPFLMEKLSKNPLKFILFIDDLSFTEESEEFSTLKAILEGSVSATSHNTVIYATSNRRHLVRESHSSRQGDDVHIRDTLEEVSSLSERFGLTVTFIRPDKNLYLQIVADYCKKHQITYHDGIEKQAERFALRRGGRNARIAKHFVESLVSSQVNTKGGPKL